VPTLIAALAFAVATFATPPVDRAGFQDAMRQVWEDHIVSAVAGLPGARPAAERLLRNQADIGDAIRPFYGDAAGDRLTGLLRQHILTAAELLTAAKAGDAGGVEDATARWNGNADQIADFLSGANPDNWPQETLRAEMRHHLELTLQEAQARLRGDWAADVAAYDAIHRHILRMADVLTDGIVRQFPGRFN
jgi:hypothetical protein